MTSAENSGRHANQDAALAKGTGLTLMKDSS